MTTEEIIYDIKRYEPEYIVKKYQKNEILKAIEIEREQILENEMKSVREKQTEGITYKEAKRLYKKIYEKKREDFNKKANEIENILEGKPSEKTIKTIRSKIVSIVKKHEFPVQKYTASKMIKGWGDTTSGFKVSAEPSYHPYEYVSVNYYISGFSPSQERIEKGKDQIDIVKKEAESLGYKVKVTNSGLEIRP